MKGIISRQRIVEYKIDNAWAEYKKEKGDAYWKSLSKLESFNIASAFFWAAKKGIEYSEERIRENLKLSTENAMMKDFIDENRELYKQWKEKYGL